MHKQNLVMAYQPLMRGLTDSQLIKRARRHDEAAFEQLLNAYQTPVFNLCYRMLGTEAEAEDAAQETFLRAYLHLRGYDCHRPFKSWLLAIASHYCIDCLRRRHLQYTALDEEQLEPEVNWATNLPEPERSVLRHEQSLVISKLLNQLNAQARLVIILRYWFDMSYVEIAHTTGTTLCAVKSRLHRARAELAQRLATDEFRLAAQPISFTQPSWGVQ